MQSMKIAAAALAAMTLVGAIQPATAQDACATTTEGTLLLADYPAVRAFYDAYTTANPDLVDCALTDDWTTHPGQGDATGPAAMKPGVEGLKAVFSQYTFKVEDVVAQDDKVSVRTTVTAVQSGPFLGVPAGEQPVQFQTIDIHRLEDGKIAETWHVEDWLSFLLQRGALPLK